MVQRIGRAKVNKVKSAQVQNEDMEPYTTASVVTRRLREGEVQGVQGSSVGYITGMNHVRDGQDVLN